MTHDQKSQNIKQKQYYNKFNRDFKKKIIQKTNMDPVFDHMVRDIVAGKIFLKK